MTAICGDLVLLRTEAGVAELTLNRPQAGNSLSCELVQAMRTQLDALAADKSIKVVIIVGAGGRIFSAGHDLNEFAGDPDPEFLEQDFAGITALMQQIMSQPQIVIAKVEGVATAAGCELVAACDIALASTDARFGVPGVNIGFWCHTPQVPLFRQVGRKQAMAMLATGELFGAEHAMRIGLVNSVHEPSELNEALDVLVQKIASKPASVLRRGKASFSRQADMPIVDAYALARQHALANVAAPDALEGIAAFLEKRTPDWPEV